MWKVAVVAGLFATLLPGFAHAADVKADHWYLQRDDGKWCSYASEAEWMGAEGYSAADARFVAGQPETVEVFQSDESGDWYLADAYTLADGVIVHLDRQFNTFYFGEVSLLESYDIVKGKAKRASRRLTPLNRDETLPDNPEVQIDQPVISHAADFPFHAVMTEKPGSGSVCR